MWPKFKAINRRIVNFTDAKSKVTLANIVAWAGGGIGLITSFSGGFDWIAPRVIGYLTGKPEVTAAWQPGVHWGSKTLVSLLIVAFFYLLVFSVQAMVLLSESAKPDYRVGLADAIGVTFTRILDYYDVISKEGDCYVILEADFLVGDLAVSHVERKYGSNSAISRGEPRMEVPALPSNIQHTTQATPPPIDPLVPRKYHFRFVPPLSHTAMTTTVKITEEVTRGVWMYLEDVPDNPVLGGKLESIGHLVNEPTDLLVLEIVFPRSYTVTGERQFKVRLGSTENPHVREEQRLQNEGALKPEIEKGRQKLRLTVKRPMMGLCYYLCWVPPRKT